MISRKFLFSIIVLAFLQGCSDVWLGESEQEVKLEGDRIDIIQSSDWLQDEGFSENKIILNNELTIPEGIGMFWKARIGKSGVDNLKFKPVVSGNKIYTFDNRGNVSCVDAETGKKDWQVLTARKKEETTGIFGGGVAVGKKSVLVSTGFGDLFSLDKDNGGLIWRYSSIAPFNSAPYIEGEVVIAVNRENETIALEEASGEIIWKHKGTPEDASVLSDIPIVGNPRMLISTYTSGEVYALIPQNGREIWSDSLGLIKKNNMINSISNISSGAVMSDDVLIATSLDSQMVALSLQSGNRVWQKNLKPIITPVLIEDYLFIVTAKKELIALSSLTGEIFWKADLNDIYEGKNFKWSNLAVYENQIVLNTSAEDIVFFSAIDGSVTFKKDVAGFSHASPVFDGDFFYLLDASGRLKAYFLY